MRRRRMLLISVLAASVAFPATVDARPRLFGVLGGFLGGLTGIGVGHHYYRHHHHYVAHHRDTTKPQSAEAEQKPAEEPPAKQQATAEQPSAQEQTTAEQQPAGRPLTRRERRALARHAIEAKAQPTETEQPSSEPAQGLPPPPRSLASLPAANFATIEDEFFGYVVSPATYDVKFWAHGERDMIQAVFTKGSTSPSPDCSQSSQERAKPLIDAIEQATRPNEEQHTPLQNLQSALVKAFNGINATCRDVQPITPTARLKAMQERLFAIRNAGLSVRTALAAFYDSLSSEQKTQVSGDATGTTETKPGDSAKNVEQTCTAQVQAAYAWPTALIGRRVRPNEAQRTSLEALQKTLFGMAIYLKGACPNEALSTPVARLDAAMRRLDGMLYAVIAISPALDDFYGQLNNEQKARFNSIDRAST